MRTVCVWLLLGGALTAAACGSGAAAGAPEEVVQGVYQNADGTASIEFSAAGNARFSLHGVGGDCTFAQRSRSIVLTCAGEDTIFTVGGDGTLEGPEGSFLTRLTKRAS